MPLVLTAEATGGFDVEYRFLAAPPNGPLAQIRPYGRANTCGYTPALPGKYTFVVWAREVGSPNGWDAYRGMVFTVAGGTPLAGVSLAAAPPGSAAAGTPITLTATPAGGVAVSYRFFVSVNGAAYTPIRAYHPDPQCVYTPPAAGNYTFLVWAREAGSTTSWDYYSTLPYRVTTGP